MNFETLEYEDKLYFDAHLKGLAETISFIDKNVKYQLDPFISKNRWISSIITTFDRMYLCARSALKLHDVSDLQIVLSATRTLFELLIDLRLLYQDKSGDNAIKFYEFPEVERFRVAKRLAEFADQHQAKNVVPIIDINEAKAHVSKDGLNKNIQLLKDETWRSKKGKNKWPNHWSNIDLKRRCENLDIRAETMYHQLYGLLSWHAHAGSTSQHNIPLNGLWAHLALGFDTMRIILLDALEILNKVFQLDSKVNTWLDDFIRLKEFPGSGLPNELR